MRLTPQRNGWIGTFRAMASPCEVHVKDVPEAEARRLLHAVAGEASRVERKYSRYRGDNVVARINDAGGRPIVVDEETAKLLDYADELFRLSDGLFDITSGVLRRAFTFDGSDRLPSPSAVRRLKSRIGWHRVGWRSPVLTLPAGMEIDLGGIGKEYAVDRAAMLAQSSGRCLINFGGDLRVTGTAADDEGWLVGVEGIAGGRLPVKRIRLMRGALATSGDAHRFLLKNGRRYSHVLNPRTGWPVDGAPRSVTVAAPSCTQAGMLATLAMLRGAQAEAFLDDQGVEHWCIR
jgi:FAD:protein FMN transferase